MKYFIVSLLILIGCTQAIEGRDVTVYFDSKAPSLVVHKSAKSIFDLNDALKYDMFSFGFKSPNYVVYVEYSDTPNGRIAGMARPSFLSCRITLFPNTIENDLIKTVVWHEMGHCLGMGHNGEIGHIMSEKVNSFDTYSKEEIDLFISEVKSKRGIQ
jgi:hypothetical protein